MPAYTQSDILGQLDRTFIRDPATARGDAGTGKMAYPLSPDFFNFPDFSVNVDFATARLSCWRDELRWAIAIEAVGFRMQRGGHKGIANEIDFFGNCLPEQMGRWQYNGVELSITADGPEGATFEPPEGWDLRPGAESILLRGQRVPIDVSPAALQHRGIDFGPDVYGNEPNGGGILLRSLLPEYRDQMLATELELRQAIPPDLKQFLRLDEWNHPATFAGENPGAHETFQLLATALVTGDRMAYQPTRLPNTHWKNWKEQII